MMTTHLSSIPTLRDFSEAERTASVKSLLALCHRQQEQLIQQSEQLALQSTQLASQAEQLALQSEQIQLLKDEIAVLKGEKARPKIKPSTLNTAAPEGSGGDGEEAKKRGRGKPSRKKTADLEIHEEKVIELAPVPPGWMLKGYEPYVVQELEIRLKNTKYLRARYEDATGATLIGELPASIKGYHDGPQLRSYILSQSYQQPVPQELILGQFGNGASRSPQGN